MDIVRCQPQDAETLTTIAFAAKRYWGYPEIWIQSWRDALTIEPEFVAANETYAAVVGGQTIGFYALTRKDEQLHLLHLWVLPEAMRRGVGRALFQHAVERTQALGFRRLAIESDPNAEPFYQRLGTRRVGTNISEVEQQRRELPNLVFEIGQQAAQSSHSTRHQGSEGRSER